MDTVIQMDAPWRLQCSCRTTLALMFLFLACLSGCRHVSPGTGTTARPLGSRRYLVHAPSLPPPPGGFPLVIALHGARGTAAGQEKLTHLSTLADREGFLAVYGEGIGSSWNDGRPSSNAAKAGADDVGYVRSIVEAVARDYPIDRSRIYALGMSNGGMMTLRLACELAEDLAAVGSVTGQMPEALEAKCRPPRTVPVMLIAGTEDPLMPYSGGELPRGMGRVLSAEATFRAWGERNGCKDEMPAEFLVDTSTTDETRVRRARFKTCGAETQLLTVEGGGHTWPNGWQYLGEWLIGRTSKDIDATEELWRFFSQHRRLPSPSSEPAESAR